MKWFIKVLFTNFIFFKSVLQLKIFKTKFYIQTIRKILLKNKFIIFFKTYIFEKI